MQESDAEPAYSNSTVINSLKVIGANVVTVTNSSFTKNISNAYEWRFILPPYFLIFILSVFGNCFVIATLASNRRMRTVTNVYLLNLAISDFLLGVFCLPFTLVGQIYRRFLFGATMCKLVPFLQAVSVSVDVWTLVAISLERYYAICRPLKSRQWQTQCHAYKMIATVWCLSLVLNSPILYVSTLQKMRIHGYKCREVWMSDNMERTFNLGLDVALLLVPFFIMSFAYCLIVRKLWKGMRHEIQYNFNWQRNVQTSCKNCKSNLVAAQNHVLQISSPDTCCVWKKDPHQEVQKQIDSENNTLCMHTPLPLDFRHAVRSTHIDKSIEAKRKVIRMLFVIILEFFVCWTPVHVINTIYLFFPEQLYQYIGSKGIISLQLLAYCSSCSNPITYCFMNRKFRQAFISLIRNCRIFRNGGTGRRGMSLAAVHTACAHLRLQRYRTPRDPPHRSSNKEKKTASSSFVSRGREQELRVLQHQHNHFMNDYDDDDDDIGGVNDVNKTKLRNSLNNDLI